MTARAHSTMADTSARLAKIGRALAESARDGDALDWPDAFTAALEIERDCDFTDGPTIDARVEAAALYWLPAESFTPGQRRTLVRDAWRRVRAAFNARACELR